MRFSLVLAVVAALVFSVASITRAELEEGFVPLFDGKSLDGWQLINPDGEGYIVQDGLLVCPAGSSGLLFTEDMYSDFILRLEFRLEPEANNGVGIRAALEGGNPSFTGMEIQILDDHHPRYRHLANTHHTGTVYRIFPSRYRVVHQPGEWNQMEITARERLITVRLNGRVVTYADLNSVTNKGKFFEQPGFVRFRGYVGLLGHKPSKVEFRNIRIKDITEPRPDNVPPKGFTALFNGEDLTGWQGLVANPPERAKMSAEELANAQEKADEQMRAHWTVKDGVLHYDGGGANLCTVKDYKDFELLLDWKIEPGGDSGVYLRGTPQVQIWDNPVGSGGLYNNQKNESNPSMKADNPPGEWNRMHIVMVGQKVNVFLNDHLVVYDVIMENYWERDKRIYPTGPIELQHHGSKLYFKNIFIRELP